MTTDRAATGCGFEYTSGTICGKDRDAHIGRPMHAFVRAPLADGDLGGKPGCVLNGCERKQGIGTWCRVTGLERGQPVCEEHWQVLRTVAPTGSGPAALGSVMRGRSDG